MMAGGACAQRTLFSVHVAHVRIAGVIDGGNTQLRDGSPGGGDRMRLSEFEGKEVINLTDAQRLGTIRDAQALIDVDAGKIEAILVPFAEERFWNPRHKTLAIPWRAIRRLGREIVIVEIKSPSRETETANP